jgi:hypothetical protein
MLSPETMQATLPLPARRATAAATATDPAPSAITRTRSAIRRVAEAASSSGTTNEPSIRSRAWAHTFGLVDLIGAAPDRERRAGASAASNSTARRCAAAYYPEANVLVPLEATAEGSHTGAFKSTVLRLDRAPSEGQG